MKFDPIEHSRIVDVRHRVQQAQQNHHCADPKLAKYQAENLDSDVAWLVLYTQYIPNNESAERMATELKKLQLILPNAIVTQKKLLARFSVSYG